MNNFQIVNADTDSISFCKPDGGSMSKEERTSLVKDINDISPELMLWADDGYYKNVVIVKAKNYILQKEDGSLKIKGSGLKGSTKEKALQQFIKDIINAILNETNDYTEIYTRYVKEILTLKDMTRWCTRKTITKTVLESKRTNETKVVDCIQGTEYVEGDRILTFYKEDESLCLLERFDGKNYSIDKLLGKLYDTACIFETILDVNNLFLNYKLKRNKIKLMVLEELRNA